MRDSRKSGEERGTGRRLSLYTEEASGEDAPSGASEQPSVVKICIGHYHGLIRKGIASLFDDPQYKVTTFNSTDEAECVALTNENPHVVISDLKFTTEPVAQNWMSAHRDKTEDVPWIVILDRQAIGEMHETILYERGPDPSIGSAAWLSGLMNMGVMGYVDMQEMENEIARAVKKVLAGRVHFSESLFGSVQKSARQKKTVQEALKHSSCPLTARELEVLQLIADRLSNKKIAKQLSVSLYTVKNHVHNILEKLQAEARFEAADIGANRGWVKKKGIR